MNVQDYPNLLNRVEQICHDIDTQGTLAKIVRLCQETAAFVVQYTHEHPYASIALLNSLSDRGSQDSSLGSPLLLALTGHRLQFNEHYLRQLVSAAIAMMCFCRSSIGRERLPSLQASLHKTNLNVWIEALQLQRLIQRPIRPRIIAHPVLSDSQRWILVSYLLVQATPSDRFDRLAEISRRAPTRMRAALAYLSEFPIQSMAGMQLRHHHRSLIAIHQSKQHCQFAEYRGSAIIFCAQPNSSLDWKQARPVVIEKWLTLFQRFNSDSSQSRLPRPYKASYVTNRPPGHILDVLDLLQSEDAELTAVEEKVSRDPTLFKFLTQSASQDNRLQLPVSDLKQAILTYGFERVGDMMVQQVLSNRLQQKYFPLQPVCIQIQVLMASLATELAAMVPCGITPQSAALLATFSTAPLFTLAELKTTRSLPVQPTQQFTISALVGLPVRHLITELAVGWQQPPQQLGILQQWGKMPHAAPKAWQRPYCILLLSLYWTRKWLLLEDDTCPSTDIALQQAMDTLKLETDTEHRLFECFSQHCYIPQIEGKFLPISPVYRGNNLK